MSINSKIKIIYPLMLFISSSACSNVNLVVHNIDKIIQNPEYQFDTSKDNEIDLLPLKNIPAVHGVINGNSGIFVLDTGASTTFIFSDSYVSGGSSGQYRPNIIGAAVSDIIIGPLTMRRHPYVIASFKEKACHDEVVKAGVLGVIGADFFSNVKIVFDNVKQKIRLSKPTEDRRDGNLTTKRSLPYIKIKTSVNGKTDEHEALLDTGSSDALFIPVVNPEIEEDKIEKVIRCNFGGFSYKNSGVISSLSFEENNLGEFKAVFPQNNSKYFNEYIVGLSAFKDKVLSVDIHNRRIDIIN